MFVVELILVYMLRAAGITAHDAAHAASLKAERKQGRQESGGVCMRVCARICERVRLCASGCGWVALLVRTWQHIQTPGCFSVAPMREALVRGLAPHRARGAPG